MGRRICRLKLEEPFDGCGAEEELTPIIDDYINSLNHIGLDKNEYFVRAEVTIVKCIDVKATSEQEAENLVEKEMKQCYGTDIEVKFSTKLKS